MLEALKSDNYLEGLLYQGVGLRHRLKLEYGSLGQTVKTLSDFCLCSVCILLLQLPLEQRQDLLIDFVCRYWTTTCAPIEELCCLGWCPLVPAHIEHVIVLGSLRIEVSLLSRRTARCATSCLTLHNAFLDASEKFSRSIGDHPEKLTTAETVIANRHTTVPDADDYHDVANVHLL